MDIQKKYIIDKHYDISAVLNSIECYSSNLHYNNYENRLEELIEENLINIQPVGYIIKDTANEYLPSTGINTIYCLVSLGAWIDLKIKELFEEHEFLDAMMMNALADNILYDATKELYKMLTGEIETKGLFLTSRYEPGNSNVPIEIQKQICDLMVETFNLDLSITEGFMLSPLKSLVYFYGITTKECDPGIDHDCSLCSNISCKFRGKI